MLIEYDPNKTKILVVDDDDSNRKFFMEILKKRNYLVDEAASGEIALKSISKNDYDLVISDLHMYQIGGLDVLDAAKNKDEHTQVLILTGFGSIPTAVKAMKNGAFEYLTKPIDKEAFITKVHNALERRRLQILLESQQEKIQEYHKAIERDLNLAKKVQDSLVPQYMDNGELAVGIEYLPMIGLGGDFADIYDNQKGNVFLTIIDVTGHGIAAALMVNRLCSEVGKLVREELDPRRVLYELNHFFCDSFQNTGMFVTVMSVKIDLDLGILTYSGSAHPAGLLYRQQEKKLLKLQSQNAIIGFEESGLHSFKQGQVFLQKDDRIILYTDGIIESENAQNKAFGLAGLRDSLARNIHEPVALAAKSIIQDVLKFSQRDLRDDVLLLIAQKM
ncbi:MAG: SpoIIE family protein phosphatase [Calditrichaeota bacterium]|nr:SpoIIE family protein phosphatase [Calditrichota bacterium]